MSQITIEVPSHISAEEAKLYLAIKLYELEKVSLGRAAKIAGIPKEKFMEVLGKHKIPVFNYGPEDLEKEMKIWEAL